MYLQTSVIVVIITTINHAVNSENANINNYKSKMNHNISNNNNNKKKL